MTKKFSPSRERSERLDNALSRLFTHNAQPTTDLKCTRPTASGPPRSSGDLDQEHQDQPAKLNWRDLESLRLEVRGQRSEERKETSSVRRPPSSEKSMKRRRPVLRSSSKIVNPSLVKT